MDVGLPAAFGAGTLTLLSPCVLPMVPILLGILLGASAESVQGRGQRGRLLRSVALFALGFGAVFTLLGLGASVLGDSLRAHRDTLLLVGAGVLVLFGLRFLGLLRLPWLERTAALRAPRTGHRGLDALVGGVVFGLGWTPCAGPILGSVLTLAAATAESPWSGAALLMAYSAGIALPMLVLALFAEALLPRLRRLNQHLPRIERATGVLLVAGGLVLALGAGLPAGLTTDETPVAGTSDQGAIEPPLGAVSPRPRLVEFYGPDCPVCQRVAPAVRTLQQDCTGQRIEVLTVDVGQPENRELVQRLGIRAIPTFVALDAAGEERVRFVGERGLDDLRSVAALLIDRSCAGVDGSRAGVATGVDGAGCPEGAETAAAEDAFTAAAPVCGG